MVVRFLLLAFIAVSFVFAEIISIHKVDYPEPGLCGEEHNVTKSRLNPHWLFPMAFGGFREGRCSDIGYTMYVEKRVVHMNPFPGVHHDLTFYLYAPSQTRTVNLEVKDPARNRVVKMKFCMPSGNGSWPLYIFGHGAGCDAEDYQYFCQVAATAMVYQDSSAGPIFPADFDTAAAAIDAKFLAEKLPQLSQSTSSYPFYERLDGTIIMGGHSMGGGMTVLSVGRETAKVDGVALFAPGLYTKIDAAPFLKNISVPALVVSGSMDCGPNSLDKEARPAFNGLASASKVLVVLKGANHCQWIEPFEKGFGVCSTFEKNECHSITRAEQHSHGADLVRAFTKGLRSLSDWDEFEKFLASGEAAAMWTYFSSKTSPASKTLHNDCPCTSGNHEQVVI
jgi:predicted dienelactone hydrolase